jgi:hypothetical protein
VTIEKRVSPVVDGVDAGDQAGPAVVGSRQLPHQVQWDLVHSSQLLISKERTFIHLPGPSLIAPAEGLCEGATSQLSSEEQVQTGQSLEIQSCRCSHGDTMAKGLSPGRSNCLGVIGSTDGTEKTLRTSHRRRQKKLELA